MRVYPFFINHGGCPHRCCFCNQSASVGLAPPAPSDIPGQLRNFLAHGSGGELAYYGGSFTLLPQDLQRAYLAAATPFLESGQLSGIRISTRPDALAAEQVAFLHRFGVTTIEVGCQSFSAAVLRLSGRGHGPDAAPPAIARVQAAGIRVGIQLMPGLPGGDCREALDSLARALELQPDFLRLYPALVLRDTPLAEAFIQGRYQPLTLADAVALCARMHWLCRQRGVPIIRTGLQASEGLAGDALLAGPYHPAFGQLVRSHLWLRALRQLAADGVRAVQVPVAELSDALAQRRANLLFLQREFPAFTITGAVLEAQTLVSSLGTHALDELAAY